MTLTRDAKFNLSVQSGELNLSVKSSIKLTLPMPPNLANRPMHHMVKHRVKLGYWAAADVIVLGHTDAAGWKAIVWLGSYAGRCKIPALRHQMQPVLRALADVQALRSKYKPPTPTGWERATIRATMYLGSPMDDGNAMNRVKWCEDWLTTRGFIADDRKKCLTWSGFPEQIVKRDGNYRVEITLDNLHEIE